MQIGPKYPSFYSDRISGIQIRICLNQIYVPFLMFLNEVGLMNLFLVFIFKNHLECLPQSFWFQYQPEHLWSAQLVFRLPNL